MSERGVGMRLFIGAGLSVLVIPSDGMDIMRPWVRYLDCLHLDGVC